ncbi:MAG: triose-phosphate isomerase [Chloroflexi bacterium]|nr:triose-phosphate isomerase [Chloroflexota bacterium]
MRKPFIAANWKMFKTSKEAVGFVQDIEELVEGVDAEIVICPPFTALKSISTVMWQDKPNYKLGAQNMFWEEEGAFTGEVSPRMLNDLGVDYVIVGHSERRQYFGETDETVNKKVKAALAHGIVPIVCCGESLEQREAGNADRWVGAQIAGGLEGLAVRDIERLVVAYEPIWAIGTGRNALPEDADAMGIHIRNVIGRAFGDGMAGLVPILYGGSVKPENMSEFMKEEHVDGALVGGASLKVDSFAEICRKAIT